MRETDRDTQTHTHRHTHTDRQTHTHTHTTHTQHTHTLTQALTYARTHARTHAHTHTHTHTQRGQTETERETRRQRQQKLTPSRIVSPGLFGPISVHHIRSKRERERERWRVRTSPQRSSPCPQVTARYWKDQPETGGINLAPRASRWRPNTKPLRLHHPPTPPLRHTPDPPALSRHKEDSRRTVNLLSVVITRHRRDRTKGI